MINQPDFAQDPAELFDVVNEDGSPTGIVKRRADVHRDGDWHRAVHIWVYGVDNDGPYLLFNLRSRLKDTYPLCLDVTVGGHLGAGETVEDAFREVHEEIGIEAQPDLLEAHGTRKAIGDVERELQDVFLYREDRPLAEYRPNPAELEGLVKMRLVDALAMYSEAVSQVEAVVLRAERGQIEPFTVTQASLTPSRHFGYYLEIAQVIDATLRAR